MSASPGPGTTAQAAAPVRRLTVADIARFRAEGQRFAAITAYDYPTARIVDEAGIPVILVGDSLGMVMLGYESTVRVTLDEMLHHTRAVVRGTRRALVVADMPFLSYGVSVEESVEHAGRFLSDAGADAVKVEGGVRSARTIEAIVGRGIAVMGHIGLTPQAVSQLGGFRVQGRSKLSARALLADAMAVQEAGAFAVVLELVPAELARAITERLEVPTIGIGAGPWCSGEIQVVTDVVGLTQGRTPRHARRFGEVGEAFAAAVAAYRDAVVEGSFPSEAESSSMEPEVLDEVLGRTPLDQPEEEPLAIPLDRDL
jgi:3-methyl-2-oxobutanoate hydroxymethyltransferase